MKRLPPVPRKVALAIHEFEQALLAPSIGPFARVSRYEAALVRLRKSIAEAIDSRTRAQENQ